MPKRAGKAAESARSTVPVDLALQGGGSHGAFTWGVLDRILEEPWLKIEAISGTSAGAMNGAVLVSGCMQGGAAGARAALDAYWGRVAHAARFSPLQRSPLERHHGKEHRLRPSRADQDLPAPTPRDRHQIPRQLSALVPPHRDRALSDTQRLPECRHRPRDQSGHAYSTLVEPFEKTEQEGLHLSSHRPWSRKRGPPQPALYPSGQPKSR